MKLNDLKLMFINKWLGHNLGFTQDRKADLEEIADWWIEKVDEAFNEGVGEGQNHL